MEPVQAPAAPLVSVLVISNNRAAALRRCLAALEASKERDRIEVLVVDTGSSDESPRLDAEFPNTTFLRLPKNFGRTKALNIGVRTAVGESLLFLTPEVEMAPDAIPALAACLEAEAGAVAVCPFVADPSGAAALRCYPFPTAPGLYAAWKRDAAIPPQEIGAPAGTVIVEWAALDALLARKYFIKGLNYFDERYGEFLADAELSYQIRRAGKKILVLGTARALRSDDAAPPPDAAARALLSADLVSGVATFAAKHNGIAAGIGYRLRAMLSCLGALLSLRDPAYQWRRFAAVASFRKVDGSQTESV